MNDEDEIFERDENISSDSDLSRDYEEEEKNEK
jgi:hypothetical protein